MREWPGLTEGSSPCHERQTHARARRSGARRSLLRLHSASHSPCHPQACRAAVGAHTGTDAHGVDRSVHVEVAVEVVPKGGSHSIAPHTRGAQTLHTVPLNVASELFVPPHTHPLTSGVLNMDSGTLAATFRSTGAPSVTIGRSRAAAWSIEVARILAVAHNHAICAVDLDGMLTWHTVTGGTHRRSHNNGRFDSDSQNSESKKQRGSVGHIHLSRW